MLMMGYRYRWDSDGPDADFDVAFPPRGNGSMSDAASSAAAPPSSASASRSSRASEEEEHEYLTEELKMDNRKMENSSFPLFESRISLQKQEF